MQYWARDNPQGAVTMYFKERLEQEQDTGRTEPMSALPDQRVDACLCALSLPRHSPSR